MKAVGDGTAILYKKSVTYVKEKTGNRKVQGQSHDPNQNVLHQFEGSNIIEQAYLKTSTVVLQNG